MPRRPRIIYAPPELPNATILNPERGFFSIVVPIARTNEVTNPSFETNTTNYTAVGGSIAQSATRSYHGAYSLAVTPTAALTDGVYYGTISMTAGQVRAVSCKFWGAAGVKYKISVATTGGVDLAVYRFVGTGRWQWVWVYYTETSTTTRRIYFTKDSHASTAIFYIDGVQSEVVNAGELVSTYIDGDQAGLLPNQLPAPFRWAGTPHASTSTRDVTTRAGGYVLNLDKFRYIVTGLVGLGLMTVANIANVGAATDGSAFASTIAQSRQFTVGGHVAASTLPQLQRQLSALYSIVGPDSTTPRQPLVLLYQGFDRLQPTSDTGRIVASYQSGLEGVTTNRFMEKAPITFTQYLPAILVNDSGAVLTVQQTIANANAILHLKTDGSWEALGTGASGGTPEVSAFAQGKDGRLYAGGDFTLMGGVANTVRIAYYDLTDSAWHAMSTGASSNSVNAITIGPDGKVYVGGGFANLSGVANTAGIGYWDGSWHAMGTGLGGGVINGLAFNQTDGKLYAVGTFPGIGGVANTQYVGRWTGSAWEAVGTGLSGGTGAWAIAVDRAGRVYVGGSFNNASGTTVANIAQYDPGSNTWSVMADGLGTAAVHFVYRLGVSNDARVYATGTFIASGSLAASRAAVWNGTGWAALGTGLNNTSYVLACAADGTIYYGGLFTTAGSITLPDSLARWNGSAWVYPSVNLPGTASVFALYPAPDGSLYIGFNTTGSATASAATSVTNGGTALAYPVLYITGPSSGSARLYELRNTRTGYTLYLNYSIAAGERLAITQVGRSVTLTSDTYGDVSGAILPGSVPGFVLAKGTNSISFFADSSSVVALMSWANGYQSINDLTW